LIKAIDGRTVGSADDLLDAIENKQPGNAVVLDIVREGRPMQVTVILGQGE
jgi:S1-C subfamily serine protease